MVIETCRKYPDSHNNRIMGSCFMLLGQIELETNNRESAFNNFCDVEKILRETLFQMLAKNGQ